MSKFKKGKPKTGGRSKGTPNKTTEQLRSMVMNFVSENMENIQKDFDQLQPRERIKVISDMMKFVLPTLRAMEQYETPRGVDEIKISFSEPPPSKRVVDFRD
jgi:hypothetical protein